jgi:transketolase
VAELPLAAHPMPARLLEQIAGASRLLVAEEHVARGGVASELALFLACRGLAVPRITHLHALAHHYDRYGSQAWLRRQSRLDPASLLEELA